jgi:hypothetical protein
MNWNDVWMLKTGEEADFLEEANFAQLAARVDVKNLDRDEPVVAQVARKVDARERTLTELAVERIASG